MHDGHALVMNSCNCRNSNGFIKLLRRGDEKRNYRTNSVQHVLCRLVMVGSNNGRSYTQWMADIPKHRRVRPHYFWFCSLGFMACKHGAGSLVAEAVHGIFLQQDIGMIRTNIEIGILRIYYVLWAMLLLWGLCVGVVSIFIYPERIVWDVIAWTSITIIIGPPAFMFTMRWIYRGFIPKSS